MRWTGTRKQTLVELQEGIGLGIVSARGVLAIADRGGEADLGFGQVLRRSQVADYEIVGECQAAGVDAELIAERRAEQKGKAVRQ